MESRQRELVLVSLLLAASASIARGQDGTASGHLTLDAVTVPLTYAYATAQPGAFDKNTEDIRVLLSDVALSDAALADVFELIHLGRDDKAHIVEVVIDATGSPISGALYAKRFDGMISASGMHRFTRERMEPKLIAGKLAVDEPHSFMGVTWQYEATFSAPIPRAPTAEETAAAIASPPGQAAAAYLAAVRRADLAAFVATLAPSAAADYRGKDALARLKELRDSMPPDTRLASLTKKRDGSTLASLEGHEKGVVIAYTLKMVLDGDKWRVDK